MSFLRVPTASWMNDIGDWTKGKRLLLDCSRAKGRFKEAVDTR